jgi:sigma-B regulation protein RsbU (phosphoserine phosphatase)
MTTNNSTPHEEPKLRNVFREDFQRGDLKRTITRDFNELREFFLDEGRKKRLAEMNWFQRVFALTWWLLKGLFLKLTPARRILVLVGCILIFISRTIQFEGEHMRVSSDTNMVGGLFILFVLMLELKDKLLAHEELESGRAIQSALMPERSPVVGGWSLWLFNRTANEVGGDLIDFQTIGPGRYGVALADVAGKGLRAALLMAKLQATMRALTPETGSISELGKKINRIFYRDGVRSIFASLVYIELEENSGILRLMNAGHLPPMMISEAAITELPKGNPAIGIFPDTEYAEERLDVHKGEILLVYSDGLTDAKNEAGEFYGIQRLKDLLPRLSTLPAPGVGEQIVKEIDGFAGDAKVFDDLSLAILKRTG